jgi:hypothetical protein
MPVELGAPRLALPTRRSNPRVTGLPHPADRRRHADPEPGRSMPCR